MTQSTTSKIVKMELPVALCVLLSVLSTAALPNITEENSKLELCRRARRMAVAIGYLYAMVAAVLYGSNLVPLKKIDVGDGFFFQFIMAINIWMTSVPLAVVYQDFKAVALLGGFVWCSGNIMCFVVIRLIGVGLGVLVWGSAAMLTGSLTSKWGLFGLQKHDNASDVLYVVGIALVLAGLAMFLLVKTEGLATTTDDRIAVGAETGDSIESPLLHVHERGDASINSNPSPNLKVEGGDLEKADVSSWSGSRSRAVGAVLAILAGVLFGSCFDFSQYDLENVADSEGNSPEALSYVFSHFTGILIFSWIYFAIYCLYMKCAGRRPFLSPDIVFASSLSGVLWGVAGICQFLGNEHLGFQIAFPIICSGPGFVSALWSVLYFKEIRGRDNLAALVSAFSINVIGLVLIARSI